MVDTKTSAPHSGSELVRTHAERLALEERERVLRRRRELAEQRSDLNPPETRIRAWEKLHALRLPQDPVHPILEVIASDTGLTRSQVRAEQSARAARRAAPAGADGLRIQLAEADREALPVPAIRPRE